jgi:hypothetical protein
MDSTEKSRQFWHQAAVRAQTAAAFARAVLDYPRSETQAINDVQLLLDQFWRMGFCPTNAIARQEEPRTSGAC